MEKEYIYTSTQSFACGNFVKAMFEVNRQDAACPTHTNGLEAALRNTPQAGYTVLITHKLITTSYWSIKLLLIDLFLSWVSEHTNQELILIIQLLLKSCERFSFTN